MKKIVLIDTGIAKDYSDSRITWGISVLVTDGELGVAEGYEDHIGHGTAVADTLLKNAKDVEVYVIKIYDDDIYVDIAKLCYAIKYAHKNLEFDILHISSGTPVYSKELDNLIKEITEDNKIVVSAFDNKGSLSYPASLDNVIGVDINADYTKAEMYDVIFNNVVDIRAGNAFHRVRWIDGKKNIVQGSSVAAALFTGKISQLGVTSKHDILTELSKGAVSVITSTVFDDNYDVPNNIKKAIVFPFNKEVYCLAANEDLLTFEVSGYYDIKHKFLVGKKVSEVLPYTDNEAVIGNFENIDWSDDFDTVIVGCIADINKLVKKDYYYEILKLCSEHGKRVYFFDDLCRINGNYFNTSKIFSPIIRESFECKNRFGKLRVPNVPVLAVMGTSSKQGKYSIQLALKREFLKRGIKADGIATEPSGLLFGFSHVYPFGYGGAGYIPSSIMINILNEKVWELEKDGCEIVLTGCQSGTVTYDFRNMTYLTTEQYSYLLGVNPDGVILCVNTFDEMKYILRTKSFIESSVNAKVIAVVISESRYNKEKGIFTGVKNLNLISKEDVEKSLNIPTFSLSDLNIGELADVIIDYYS